MRRRPQPPHAIEVVVALAIICAVAFAMSGCAVIIGDCGYIRSQDCRPRNLMISPVLTYGCNVHTEWHCKKGFVVDVRP